MSETIFGGPTPLSGIFADSPLWDQAFWLEMPLEVRSKSNFRRQKSRSSRSSWQSFSTFESSLAHLVNSAVPEGWDMGAALDPLPRRPAVVAFMFAHSILDAANLPKSVLDACEDLVYHNDASVRYCASLGVRTKKTSGGLLAFARLAPSASLRDMVGAAHLLESCSLDLIEPNL